jgi:hypothetical protein
MANPVQVFCPRNTWKRVAQNVTVGQIKKLNKKPANYLETYRDTGQTAPTDQTEGVPIFLQNNYEGISASSAIDIYIMAVGKDGKVRVDLP